VDFFREKVLRAGAWDPTRGATIKTYFMGACLFQFPNVYQSWQAECRRWDSLPVVSIDDLDIPELLYQVPGTDDTENRVIARDQLQRVMAELRDKYPDLHQIVEMWMDGYTDAQAAGLLGVTPRTIEGKWHRFRRSYRRSGSAWRPA
jgi:DNA-directed RNA polymerase specialized sigma24 family protein